MKFDRRLVYYYMTKVWYRGRLGRNEESRWNNRRISGEWVNFNLNSSNAPRYIVNKNLVSLQRFWNTTPRNVNSNCIGDSPFVSSVNKNRCFEVRVVEKKEKGGKGRDEFWRDARSLEMEGIARWKRSRVASRVRQRNLASGRREREGRRENRGSSDFHSRRSYTGTRK